MWSKYSTKFLVCRFLYNLSTQMLFSISLIFFVGHYYILTIHLEIRWSIVVTLCSSFSIIREYKVLIGHFLQSSICVLLNSSQSNDLFLFPPAAQLMVGQGLYGPHLKISLFSIMMVHFYRIFISKFNIIMICYDMFLCWNRLFFGFREL